MSRPALRHHLWPYQQDALAAFEAAGDRVVIAFPMVYGGKTVVAQAVRQRLREQRTQKP